MTADATDRTPTTAQFGTARADIAQTGETRIYLTTSAVVGPFDLQIVARYEKGDPTKTGWLLSGATVARANGISVSELLKEVAQKLGVDPSFPPGILPELDVTGLGVSYDTSNDTTGLVLNASSEGPDLLTDPFSLEETTPDLQMIFYHRALTSEDPEQSVVGARYTAPIALPEAPGILKGVFDQLTITDLLGAYASAPAKDLTIPGINATDPLTGEVTEVSKDLKLSLEKGFSFLATLTTPGSTEQLALNLGASSATPVRDSGNALEAGQVVSKWFDVNKKFGPLAIQRIGIEWNDGLVSLLFDASIKIAVLTIGLDGLSIGFTLDQLIQKDFVPTIGLSGLAVSYSGGAVDISGAFIRDTSDGKDAYSGQASIKVETFSIGALGSYEQSDGHPSMFIFVMLNATLGGPSYFFVTGLAGGFGYNRSLKLPSQDNIVDFPLVRAAIDPAASPTKIEAALKEKIKPDLGQNWLAAGVRFTSFEMLESFALVTVAFGNNLEIALLGVTTLEIPKGAKNPVAVAQLQLKVQVIPADGTLTVAGGLTPESYILSKDCRLTGGFAFNVWFGDHPHVGDFVVTFGGYNPNYKKPAWYPDEKRIGFRWIDGKVTIGGDCYFALTPHAVMAGGELAIVYKDDDLRAWFSAKADFLLEWKPFYYEIEAGVHIGVSYRGALTFGKRVKVEVGAKLSMSGPPLIGTADISLYFISFTVDFGADSSSEPPPPLTWPQFQTSFLPQLAGSTEGTSQTDAVQLRFARGILKEVREEQSNTIKYRIVNAYDLELITESVIPCTEITIKGTTVTLPENANTKVSVRPMRDPSLSLESTHKITATPPPGAEINFHIDPGIVVLGNLPSALWAVPESTKRKPSLNSTEQVLTNVPRGAVLTIDPPEQPEGGVGPFPIQRLDFDDPEYHAMVWGKFRPPPNDIDQKKSPIEEIEKTITARQKIRRSILEELAAAGLAVKTKVDLKDFASNANTIFFNRPILSRLGDRPPKTSAALSGLGN